MHTQFAQSGSSLAGELPTSSLNTMEQRKKDIQVLVVDDEEDLRNLLRVSLVKTGYKVTTASNGHEALELFGRYDFSLVLLDIMMPGMDGFATCVELRKRSNVAIVMLTALNRPNDIVHGFNLGADDYITKPFTFQEVEARLQAIIRRMSKKESHRNLQILAFHDIVLNDELHELSVRGEFVHLTPIEHQLLYYLMSFPDKPASKQDLFCNVWGYDMAGGTNLVEVAVRRLREKIEINPSTPEYLLTVRGVGYKFNTHRDNA